MKKQFMAVFFAATLIVVAAQQVRSAVVLSNLDPANYENSAAVGAPSLGESILTGSQPISLTSVMISQPYGTPTSDSFAVYSRNANGTLGTSLFTGFTVGFDSVSQITTAKVSSTFTLQANTGYWFVLKPGNSVWGIAPTTGYSAAYGVVIPATDTVEFDGGAEYDDASVTTLFIQVNGTASAAVPEPSGWVLIGSTLVVGAAVMARRVVRT